MDALLDFSNQQVHLNSYRALQFQFRAPFLRFDPTNGRGLRAKGLALVVTEGSVLIRICVNQQCYNLEKLEMD